MEASLRLTERIEAYLDGSLSPQEQARFEADLRADPRLAAEVSLHQDTHAWLRLHAYKAQLQQLDQTATVPPRRLRPALLWRAAAVLLLLILGSYLWLAQTYRYESLAQAAFQPYRDITVLRGEYPGRDTLLAAAMTAYRAADYAAALPHFETLLRMSPDYPIAQLYMGITLLATGETARSEKWLRKAAESDRLAEVANWYLGLALVQGGHLTDAQAHLAVIADDPTNYFAPQAAALRQRLDSPWRRLPGIE